MCRKIDPRYSDHWQLTCMTDFLLESNNGLGWNIAYVNPFSKIRFRQPRMLQWDAALTELRGVALYDVVMDLPALQEQLGALCVESQDVLGSCPPTFDLYCAMHITFGSQYSLKSYCEFLQMQGSTHTGIPDYLP